MPKPTLSIGGTMTAAEAEELSSLLAGWTPPMAYEEGDDRPRDIEDQGNSDYLACIKDAASAGMPLYIGAWERNDQLYGDAKAVIAWLNERADRLTWRYFEPSGTTEDGEPYNGRIEVHGAGVPEDMDVENCTIDVTGRPIIHALNINYSPSTVEQLVFAAGLAVRTFRHQLTALIIEG